MWCLILTGRSSAAKHLKENPLKMQFLVLMKLFGKLSIHSTERRAILLSLKKFSAPNIFRWLTCYSMCQLISCSDFWKIQRHLNRVQSILALNWFKFEGDRKGSMIQLCVLHCWGVHFMRGRHSLGHGFDLLVILWCQTSLHSWDVFGSKNHVLINRHWTLKLWSINRE